MAENHSQYDSFTISGQWWLPGQDKKVAGELQCRDGKIRLRLFGAFHKTTATTPLSHKPAETAIDVIHGETFKLQPITALKAFYTSWQSSQQDFSSTEAADISTSTLHVHHLLVGQHLSSLEEQSYTKCRIQLRNLEAWLV